jgi:hypothetical protein
VRYSARHASQPCYRHLIVPNKARAPPPPHLTKGGAPFHIPQNTLHRDNPVRLR